MEEMWRYNGSGECDKLNVKSINPLLSLDSMHGISKTIADANLKEKIRKTYTPEYFEKLTITVY
jgi:hypothetical protein